ncbi:hypothetical protein QS257_01200 [Terrilactibacillus sp. S3-3]|nr:hypothetical protein QS257_01200 [Terrilactibacillus sp. S3-3]
MNFRQFIQVFQDTLIIIPVVLAVAQVVKCLFPIPKPFVPAAELKIDLLFSIFFNRRHDIIAGLIMGYLYGYAAIGVMHRLKRRGFL